MMMIVLALAMMMSGAAAPQSVGRPSAMRPARFFVDGSRNGHLITAINRELRRKIDFDHRFSTAFVSCGTGCGGYYFVDRGTGAVISAPGIETASISIDDVRTEATSDVVTVEMAPSDGVGTTCTVQRFRLVGKRFVAVSSGKPQRCRH